MEPNYCGHEEQDWTESRIISSLPILSSLNYSPHLKLEFDTPVQDHCHRIAAQMDSNDFSQNFAQMHHQYFKKSTSLTGPLPRTCKVVVTGDVAVGKTCLINRFGHAVFSSIHQTTIGADFELEKFNILGVPYVLQIWDTAGLERFRCITSSYYRGCQVALIVFDMSNLSTLASVTRWRDDVLASCKTLDQLSSEHLKMDQSDSNEPLLFLVGTKCDLLRAESSRDFVIEQANKMASLIGAELWFVSARTGESVGQLFKRIAALSFNRCIIDELQEQVKSAARLEEGLIRPNLEFSRQSSKVIKITKKKEGDGRRTRCINIQCVIK